MSSSHLKPLFHLCMPLFIALGDEIRLTIIESLAEAYIAGTGSGISRDELLKIGLNVREITDKTNLSRPAVSHHLKLLKDAGIINVRKEGTSNYYYLTITDSTKKLMDLGKELAVIFPEEESFS